MEPDPKLLVALQELLRRVPGGTLRVQEVGAGNALQGMAYALDFVVKKGRFRLYILLLNGGQSYRCVSRNGGWGQPPPEDWGAEVDRWEGLLQGGLIPDGGGNFVEEGERVGLLGEEDHQVIGAALLGRTRAWKGDPLFLESLTRSGWGDDNGANLKLWFPDLSLEALADSGRRKIGRLDFSRLPALEIVESDILDFYQNHPLAHGQFSVSAPGYSSDRNSAVLTLLHSLGLEGVEMERLEVGRWKGPGPTRPEGPLPGPFCELLVLERRGGSWQLVHRLEPGLPEPEAVAEVRHRERLQRELGDWAIVEKVVLAEARLVEVVIRRPDGSWRVLWGDYADRPDPWVVLERSLWICRREWDFESPSGGTITGAAIRAAFENPL